MYLKPLLRFLYVIFYTIMSPLYLVILFGEVLLIFPIAFFYYIFTGKNYFRQDYDDMFFVKMNHKFEKIMNNMDPDYEDTMDPDYEDTKVGIDNTTIYKMVGKYPIYDVYYVYKESSKNFVRGTVNVYPVIALNEENAKEQFLKEIPDAIICNVKKL